MRRPPSAACAVGLDTRPDERRQLHGDDADEDQHATGHAGGIEPVAHHQVSEQRGEERLGRENDRRVRCAGVVLVRQRPGSAKGVMFITIEDETGSANLVLWPKLFEAFRKPAMTARVIALEGRIQRAEGVTHVVIHSLTDRSDVLARLAGLTGPAPKPGAPGRSHPRNLRVLPNSRDFH
mgnify:CR=1 FL=1